jgi:hypothetical protein
MLTFCLGVIAALATGCSAIVAGEIVPGADVRARSVVLVVPHARDERDIGSMVAEGLRARGFEASVGAPMAEPGSRTRMIVRYEDHWQWDMSMYLIVLRIDFRDPKTDELLASGQSYRTSGARMPPQEMVDEILAHLLGPA